MKVSHMRIKTGSTLVKMISDGEKTIYRIKKKKYGIVYNYLFTWCRPGVKNIGRWTQFCHPLKKKNGMNSLEGIS